jgi:acyl-CoA-dependent ceramide synthase
MDVSDAVFALAKCFNYIAFQRTSEVLLFVFLCTWTYLRHYLNLKILWSVWTQYGELVPKEARVFDFQRGVFLAPWLRYQVRTVRLDCVRY